MNTLAFLNQGQLAATFIIIFVLFLIGAVAVWRGWGV
jgi:hypothetical protein